MRCPRLLMGAGATVVLVGVLVGTFGATVVVFVGTFDAFFGSRSLVVFTMCTFLLYNRAYASRRG